MKKWILIGVVAVAPLFSQAQMKAQWHNGRGKYVCAAYGYGKFTGETGKRHKYVPRVNIFGFIVCGVGTVISAYYENWPAAAYAFTAMILYQRIIKNK